MNDLYKRFGLEVDHQKAIEIFKNKVRNILVDGQLGFDILENSEVFLPWEISNRIGIKHRYLSSQESKADHVLPMSLTWNEYLLRIQVLLDILYESKPKLAENFSDFIERKIDESPFDLGVSVKKYKTKASQLVMANSKKVRKKIVDTLGLLDAIKNDEITSHFEDAMKEYFTAKTKAQLKDVVEDLLTMCDELVKHIFNDNSLGLNHLFKNDRWEIAGLNSLQKTIFSDMKRWMDKIKHNEIKDYSRAEVELLISMTGELVGLLSRKVNQSK